MKSLQNWLRQISRRWIIASISTIVVISGILLSANTLVYNALFGPFEITEEEIIELSNRQSPQDNYAPFLEREDKISTKNIFSVMHDSYHDGKKFYFRPPTETLPSYYAEYSATKCWEEQDGKVYARLPGETTYYLVDTDDRNEYKLKSRFAAIVRNMQAGRHVKDKVMLVPTKFYLQKGKGGFLVPIGEKTIDFASLYMGINDSRNAKLQSSDILRIGMYDNERFNVIFFCGIKLIVVLFVILVVLAGINIVRYAVGYKNYKKHPAIKKCKSILEVYDELSREGVVVDSKMIETVNWRIYKQVWSIKIINKSKDLG